MRILLTYSSLTGNTKKVADGIYEILDKFITTYVPIKDINNPSEFVLNFDFIIVGFWVDKGMPNWEALNFLKVIKGKLLGIFMTLGASPKSYHATECMRKTIEMVEKNQNKVITTFICQGKVSEELINFFKTLPPNHPHALTKEKIKKYEEAAKHPNEDDIKNAQNVFLKAVSNLCILKTE
ncbi:MAG: flavodoxin family protein [Fervidobacterium sp.]|nr:flavodoxin family protein [Fervidobacterium sp.]